ncbi:DegT/DnrJ/EryC1/StrS family aminotransferase [Candidatus Woesebacteria bacterium]|nr:DegT/DnrJ/EryC1/StrS family aminotransferase [Candidatus Woesebacteria bacterium]
MNKQHNTPIPLFKVFMSKTIMKPLKQVLLSGYIGQGPQVEQLEKELSSFLGVPWLMTVNSGTSALSLALRLAGVGHNDEVISTPMTCSATNWPILAAGARIVWADIDPQTGNIDPGCIKKLITSRTKAIMCVDWGGYPSDIDALKKVAGNIPIIEDAAHALGALYKGRMVGQSADYTCFSLQAIKHLTAGDGGILVVSNKKDYKRGKLLRWYGIDRESRSQYDRIELDVAEWGYKYHMNDINATIARGNLKHLSDILSKHRRNAAYYRKRLVDLKRVALTAENPDYTSSYWLFTILVDDVRRFMKYMSVRHIMTSQVHRRNDTHSVVSEFKRKLPGVDAFTKQMVCIPVGWWLTAKERKYIVDAIKAYDSSRPRT